jgi:glutamine synthetase
LTTGEQMTDVQPDRQDLHGNGLTQPDADTALSGAGRVSTDELGRLASLGEVDTVVCAMPDLWGRLVGKRVSPHSFFTTVLGDEGLHASLYLFVVDMDMDPRPGYAMTSWDDGFRDCRMVPDLGTLRVIPWLRRTAMVLCDPVDDETGELVQVAPRVILKRQLERYRAAGMRLKCATELEFFLYADDYRSAWERRYRDLTPLSYYRSDYHVLQSSKDEGFLRRVRDVMDAADIEVEFSKSEWGLGQQEVNLRYTDALEMADRHALYKNGVKEMCAAAGLAASFMAKPRIDDIGSSCHVHLSVWDEDGEQSLVPGSGPSGMSEAFGHFVGGQVSHGRDLAVMLAPNINSYKRFQHYQFAGVSFAWGMDNRTCGLRVIGHGPSMRMEQRIPGADVNPYLTIASLAAAGLAGIEHKTPWPEPLAANAADHPECPRMPGTLGEALACFQASEFMRGAFGADVCEHLANFFQQELDAFNHETVTDWELIRYFERA